MENIAEKKTQQKRGRKRIYTDEEKEQHRKKAYKIYYENVIKPRMKQRRELNPPTRGRGRPKIRTMQEIREKEKANAKKYYEIRKAKKMIQRQQQQQN